MGTTLVTGGGGMVGHALRSLNPPDTVFLTREDVDLTDFNAVRTLFAYVKPKRIIHLAASVGGIGGNMIHSGEYFRSNIMINMNVLEAARRCGVEKLISFMSTCVFPDACRYPLNERDIHGGPPHPSNFGYAYAKRMLEVQSSAYRKEWRCNYVVAIPTNIYGPNDNWSLDNGHVVPSLIHRCYQAGRRGEDLTVWGSGKPLREFVYSVDIARLALWMLDHYDDESPLILSSGLEVSIGDLVGLVAKRLGFSGKLIWDASKPDGQFRKPSDTAKLRRLHPEFRFTGLERGIDATVDWFIANYPRVRM